MRLTPRVTTLPTSSAPLTYQGIAGLQEPTLASAAAKIPGKSEFSLLGGLDSANDATGQVITVSSAGTAAVGSLPVSLYGAAAVMLGSDEYIFGGAKGTATTPTVEQGILEYTVTGAGTITEIAKLPSNNYGLSAAVIGNSAYLVGGDTGTQTLATILSWHPGGSVTTAGTLPIALRYAAVTAVGDDLVIAGGLQANGTPSKRIFIFDSTTGKVRTLHATLPRGLYAAAGATLNKLAYVIGGAYATGTGSTAQVVPVNTIYSIDPTNGKLANAGPMAITLAESAAVVIGDTIYVAGGRSGGATVSDVGTLTVSKSNG